MKALLICAFLTACAVSDDYAYKQADRYNRALDEFKQMARACRAAGGVVYVRSHGRLGGPRAEDLRTARCMRH